VANTVGGFENHEKAITELNAVEREHLRAFIARSVLPPLRVLSTLCRKGLVERRETGYELAPGVDAAWRRAPRLPHEGEDRPRATDQKWTKQKPIAELEAAASKWIMRGEDEEERHG